MVKVGDFRPRGSDPMYQLGYRHAIEDVSAKLEGEGVPKESCICAAIRFPDGYIVRGHRHHDCLRVAGEMRRKPRDAEQGFITSRGRFVGRVEGVKLQVAAGIESASGGGYGSRLLSEDLY